MVGLIKNFGFLTYRRVNPKYLVEELTNVIREGVRERRTKTTMSSVVSEKNSTSFYNHVQQHKVEQQQATKRALEHNYSNRIVVDFEKSSNADVKHKDVSSIDITHKASQNVVSSIEDLKSVLDFSFNGSLYPEYIDLLNHQLGNTEQIIREERDHVVFTQLDAETNVYLFDGDVIKGKSKPRRKDASNYPVFVKKIHVDGCDVETTIGTTMRVNQGLMKFSIVKSSSPGVNIQLIGLTSRSLNNAILRRDYTLSKNLRYSTIGMYPTCTGIEECPSIPTETYPRANAVLKMKRKAVRDVKALPKIISGTVFTASLLFNNNVLAQPEEHDVSTGLSNAKVMERRRGINGVEFTSELESYVYGKHLAFKDVMTQTPNGVVNPSNYDQGYLTIKKATLESTKEDGTDVSLAGIYTGCSYTDVFDRECYVYSKAFAEHGYELMKSKTGLLIPRIEDERFIHHSALPAKSRLERLYNPYDGMDYGKMIFTVKKQESSKGILYYKNYNDDTISEVREIGLHPYLNYLRRQYQLETSNFNRGNPDQFAIDALEKRLNSLLGDKLFSIEFKRINLSNVFDDDGLISNPLLRDFIQEGEDNIFLKVEDEIIPLEDLKKMSNKANDVIDSIGISTEQRIGMKGITLDEYEYKEDTIKVLNGVRKYLKETYSAKETLSVCFYKIRSWNLSELVSDGVIYRDDISKCAFTWTSGLSKLRVFKQSSGSSPVSGFELTYILNHHPGHAVYMKHLGELIELKAKQDFNKKDGVYLTVNGNTKYIHPSEFEECGIADNPKTTEHLYLTAKDAKVHLEVMEKLLSANKESLLKLKQSLELYKKEMSIASMEMAMQELKRVTDVKLTADMLKLSSEATAVGKNIFGLVERLLDFIVPY